VKPLLWFLVTVLLPLLLSEFTDLSPWMAKALISRAARRIPEQERPRWEEEWLGELESKQGRLFKLLWALWRLPLLRGAGVMGRLLGASPVSQVIRARLRAAWQKLLLGPKASPQDQVTGHESEPAVVQVELSDAALAVDTLTAVGTTRSTGSVSLRPPRRVYAAGRWHDGMPHLSHEEFIEWLSQQRQELEDNLVRREQEYRKDVDRLLRG
jgi:hypothetical protein